MLASELFTEEIKDEADLVVGEMYAFIDCKDGIYGVIRYLGDRCYVVIQDQKGASVGEYGDWREYTSTILKETWGVAPLIKEIYNATA